MSQYDQSEILTYILEEGNFTVNTATLTVPGGEPVITGTFQKQVKPENFLELGAGENALKRVADGPASFFNPYAPEVDGQLPSETTTQANLPSKRIVGAVKLKAGEWFFPVAAGNAEIAVGATLGVAGAGDGVDVTTGTEDVAKALETVAAAASSETNRVYIRCILEGSQLAVVED